jgi:serine/threonine-protein kinase PknK
MADFDRRDVPGYHLIAQIGRGGSGVVYRARRSRRGREVAVKVLTTDGAGGPAISLWDRECRLAGRLAGHPGIAAPVDAGRTRSGRPYLVMEYFALGSLKDLLGRGGPLPVPEVLRIGVRMADALDAAHGQGILHRDVKPSNILLSRSGEPVLADFGTSHLLTGADSSTHTSAFTLHHVAPEVLDNQRSGAQADVYSLGSTLYELLNGSPAYQRSADRSVGQLVGRILREDPPDIERADLPPRVMRLLRLAMARRPEERLASASGFACALRDLQAELGQPVTQPASARSGGGGAADVVVADGAAPSFCDPDVTAVGRLRAAAASALVSTDPEGRVPVRRPWSRRGVLLAAGTVTAAAALATGLGLALTSEPQAPARIHVVAGRLSESPTASSGLPTARRPRAISPSRPVRSHQAAQVGQPPSAPGPAATISSPAPSPIPRAPRNFTASAVQHGATLRWSAPAGIGRTPVTYRLSWSGQSESVNGTSAAVSGLINGQSYTFTLRASSAAGSGPAVAATTSLAYDRQQYQAFDDESGQVAVQPAPTASNNPIGYIPAGSNQPLTVICQVASQTYSDPFQTWKTTDIWDRIAWNGSTAYVLDLYIATPNSAGYGSKAADAQTYPGDRFSPPLWTCS